MPRKKLIPFPPQPKPPTPEEQILFTLGDERFVVTWDVKRLPKTAPVAPIKKEV